jgi:Tfp pilus tip-associated adhesin PilY1
MAANGGSGSPIFPQNKNDLVKALTDIFGQIREEASAFASAAVPSVQAEVADRIYLSSFTPLNGAAVWDGHLDAYLKPLPLSTDGKPARSRACPAPGSPNRSSCHLWDAGEVIQGQAAALTDLNTAPAIDEAVLKLGTAPDQRRVFYAKAPFGGLIPQKMRLFSPPAGDPATDPDWSDLVTGLKIPVTTPATPATAKTRAVAILKTTLGVKAAQIDKLDGTKQDITYLLGDIFHSDPVVIDRPNDFSFYANNLNHDPSAIDCTADPGYRCYADKLKRRRKMLAVGSDDGQLHFFDGGVWDPVAKKFSDGTGRELFAVIPRAQLPVVRDLAENGRQVFGIDSTPRVHDVFLDPQHGGTPTAADRRWRTVMVGGYREGGAKDGGGRIADFTSGYYALDVTQPDQLNSSNEPIDQRVVPSCLSTTNGAVAGCGSLPFPALLWEFNDSIAGSQLDEDDVNRDGLADGNTYPDLGQTWSVPTVGRIRVIEGGQTVDKFVAIFGGGMDAESKNSPKRGTWLYMVDLETGQAIYKRQLVGAAPADPAALDVNLDGILDTLYIGTTAGLLYKVDLSQPAEIKTVTLKKNLAIPALVVDQPVQRITDPAWDPFPIFDTLGKPIYFAPTAFYVAKLSRFALGFGTGDREDLWSFDNKEGRFYLILDDNFKASQLASGQLPKDESSYQQIDAEGPDATGAADFVLNPGPGKQRGWYLRLDPSEKVITQTFGLSGVLIFSSYQPQITTQPSGNGNGNNGNGGNKSDPPVCARGGTSRIFVVYANNANSLMTVDGSASRFRQVPEFVTNPYVEQGATKNPGTSPQPNSEQLDANQRAILAALKKFFPPCAKFANYWISVSGIRSDTGYERYATIPVGVCESNWKEH